MLCCVVLCYVEPYRVSQSVSYAMLFSVLCCRTVPCSAMLLCCVVLYRVAVRLIPIWINDIKPVIAVSFHHWDIKPAFSLIANVFKHNTHSLGYHYTGWLIWHYQFRMTFFFIYIYIRISLFHACSSFHFPSCFDILYVIHFHSLSLHCFPLSVPYHFHCASFRRIPFFLTNIYSPSLSLFSPFPFHLHSCHFQAIRESYEFEHLIISFTLQAFVFW